MNAMETILIVDDEPPLRMNLRAFLEDLGFHTREAPDGLQALEACAEGFPDLVLMDISMPNLNGLEACRRLREMAGPQAPPVLFLSALPSVQDKIDAFAAGGVDYITKPFHFEEVEARIRTHLELQRQRRQLQAQNEAMALLEHQREGLTHMIVHDLRGPLTTILASVDLMEDEAPAVPSLAGNLARIRASGRIMDGMIAQMLDLGRLEAGTMPLELQSVELAGLASRTLAALQPSLGRRHTNMLAEGPVWATGDPAIVGRVLDNLLGNARKFTGPEGTITLAVGLREGCPCLTVSDNGPGIALEHQVHIFDKFSQAPSGSRKVGFGIGLAFCRLAVEAQHGQIGLESTPGLGSTFWFTLPQAPGS